MAGAHVDDTRLGPVTVLVQPHCTRGMSNAVTAFALQLCSQNGRAEQIQCRYVNAPKCCDEQAARRCCRSSWLLKLVNSRLCATSRQKCCTWRDRLVTVEWQQDPTTSQGTEQGPATRIQRLLPLQTRTASLDRRFSRRSCCRSYSPRCGRSTPSGSESRLRCWRTCCGGCVRSWLTRSQTRQRRRLKQLNGRLPRSAVCRTLPRCEQLFCHARRMPQTLIAARVAVCFRRLLRVMLTGAATGLG